jgi:hypothetical protein
MPAGFMASAPVVDPSGDHLRVAQQHDEDEPGGEDDAGDTDLQHPHQQLLRAARLEPGAVRSKTKIFHSR